MQTAIVGVLLLCQGGCAGPLLGMALAPRETMTSAVGSAAQGINQATGGAVNQAASAQANADSLTNSLINNPDGSNSEELEGLRNQYQGEANTGPGQVNTGRAAPADPQIADRYDHRNQVNMAPDRLQVNKELHALMARASLNRRQRTETPIRLRQALPPEQRQRVRDPWDWSLATNNGSPELRGVGATMLLTNRGQIQALRPGEVLNSSNSRPLSLGNDGSQANANLGSLGMPSGDDGPAGAGVPLNTPHER